MLQFGAEPGEACILKRHRRRDQCQLEVRQLDLRFDGDDSELRAVHGDEAARQRRDEIAVGERGQREHEVRHGERDTAGELLLGERGVNEAEGVAGFGDDEMLGGAVALQRQLAR